MAELPLDRRLAMFGSWRQIRARNRRKTRSVGHGPEIRGRTIFPIIAVFGIRASRESIALGRSLDVPQPSMMECVRTPAFP